MTQWVEIMFLTTRAPIVEHLINRTAVDAAITHNFNIAGARHGLSALKWRLGSIDEDIHFFGHADAYAVDLRWDIVEAWLVYLGLADEFEYGDEPIRRAGPDMLWTGTVDGVTVQLSFPASTSF